MSVSSISCVVSGLSRTVTLCDVVSGFSRTLAPLG